jgi:ribosomal protein S18 acetylase RimI-like enzyme
MSSPEVRTARPSEREVAVQILTLAFASDPAVRWIYPEPAAYLTHFPTFAEAFGGRALEHDTARLTTCLGGASLWLPPGVHADGDALGAFVQETVVREDAADVFSALEEMDRYHPEEPHWYLAMIGVDPSRQGQGMGSALLKETLATVDEQGLPAYLESSNPANVPLYERHGFEVMGEIRGGDGPPIIPMYRTAR